MWHIDELDILDHLGRGKKANESPYCYFQKSLNQKYLRYNKNISYMTYASQKAVDMVRTAQKMSLAFY